MLDCYMDPDKKCSDCTPEQAERCEEAYYKNHPLNKERGEEGDEK